MKVKLLRSFALVAGLLLAGSAVFAHHGSAALDMSKEVTFKGTITNWLWANPHCIMYFDVTDDQGKVAHWVSETSPPIGMVQLGWHKNSLRPGDEVTIVLHVARSGATVGRTIYVVLADGTKLTASAENDSQTSPPAGDKK